MSIVPTFESVSVGDELPPLTMAVDRARLVRYAGASSDFNRIHWSESTASAVGLPASWRTACSPWPWPAAW